MVAAVCTMITIEISSASGTSFAQRSGDMSGNDGVGSVAGTAPTTLTPLLSRLAHTTAAVAATRAISAPGILALIFSDPHTTASTPKPMQTV